MKISQRNIYIYLFSWFLIFLCVNISGADEVWRCAKHSGGQCIFAWWLRVNPDGKHEIYTTAGPSAHFTQSEDGRLNFVIGPGHVTDKTNDPEWIAHHIEDRDLNTQIWYINFYGIINGKYNDAVCQKAALASNATFGSSCLKYYYSANNSKQKGKLINQDDGTGGLICVQGQSAGNGIISPACSDSSTRRGSLPTINEEDALLCGKSKEERKAACAGATAKKKNSPCCNLL